MFNHNNIWLQIQLSGLRLTRKFLIQLIGSRSTIGSTEVVVVIHYNTSIISHVLHRRCVVFAVTFVTKISHESMKNVKPCCFIYNIVIDRSHVGLRVCLSTSTSKGVKNGSMTGFMSNVTLLQLFWNCFGLFWVVDRVLCGDVDPYFTVKKRYL